MATEDREDIQRAERVTLKRKLTGPPRLLLGKTRTRSAGDDGAETRTDKTKMAGRDESWQKSSAAAESETAELTDTVSSEANVKSSGGRCGAAGEGDVIRDRKVSRCKWWRIFSPAGRNRKQNKKVKESSEKQKNDECAPPEGALQETDTALLHNMEENTKRTKGMKRFKVRAWPTFKRFLTSSDEHKQGRVSMETNGDTAPMTFRKKMRKFFIKGEKRSSGVPLENMEDMTGSSAAPADEPAKLHDDVTVQRLEVVTVAAEMEKRSAAETPDETPEEEQLVCDVTEEDLKDDVKTSETIQNNSEDMKKVPVKDLKAETPEEHEVFWDSNKVVLDAEDQLSQDASGASHTPQPTTNGPSIRIELVPPDDVLQEDEEEECWEGTSSSENLLLFLLGLEHRERQLLQTARSLVRAAMKAAVDQLSRERQSDCVPREPPGCRDHA